MSIKPFKLGALLFLIAVMAVVVTENLITNQVAEAPPIYGTTLANDGVPFERYCGFLEDVGRGEIKFEKDAEPLQVVYLIFREEAAGKEKVVKTVYGDKPRLDTIKSGQYYDIARRMYGEGFAFPRRLDVVESCPSVKQ